MLLGRCTLALKISKKIPQNPQRSVPHFTFVLILFIFNQINPMFELEELLNYWWFCDFISSLGHFLVLGHYFSPFNKAKYKNVGFYEVVEMYYKMFVTIGFQFWPIFRQLAYLVNYCRFCDFDPSLGHFLPLCVIFHHLRLNINILDTI